MKPGETIEARDYLECPFELVVPGTKGLVKRVDQRGHTVTADVQFEGVRGLWNVHEREVRVCP